MSEMDLVNNYTEQEIIELFKKYVKSPDKIQPNYMMLIKYKNTHIYRIGYRTFACIPEHDGIKAHKRIFYIVRDMVITDFKTGVVHVVGEGGSHNVIEEDFLNKYDIVYEQTEEN